MITGDTSPDYSLWFTKIEAAKAIGVSTKKIEGLVKEGKIQQAKTRRSESGQWISVFAPEDVQRMERERKAAPPFVMPAGADTTAATNGNGHHAPGVQLAPVNGPNVSDVVGLLVHALESLRAIIQTIPPQGLPAAGQVQSTHVQILEASKITGLSETYIRRKCKDGSIGAKRDGGWKIPRNRLEEL